MAAPEPKPRPNRERLHTLYVVEKKSLREIGEMYDASRALVAKWLRADGTPVRTVSEGTSLAQSGKPLSPSHREKNAQNLIKARAARTDESRRKQSESMRGKVPWNKGGNLSEEHKQLLRDQRSDPEYRRIQSERFSGANNWNWKGGIKPEHAMRLDRAEWRRTRRLVYERDDWTCQDCGVKCLNSADAKKHPKRKIQAHHIVGRRYGGSDELENLVTLCMSCHHVRERSENSRSREHLIPPHDPSRPVRPGREGLLSHPAARRV